MVEIIYYMLFLTSWNDGAAEPKIERVRQLYTSQEACEAAGKRLLEQKKATMKERDWRAQAYKCFPLPDGEEFDAATPAVPGD